MKDQNVEPLFNDEFQGAPAKRSLQYILSKREQGSPVAGLYCGYAPIEVIHAMGAYPAVLCAFAQATIEAGESVLPGNLCPLIKSSYGFIKTDKCPFYSMSDVVIGETTCDGKKKMFELIADIKPTHVMDLPQVPDTREAQEGWGAMIGKVKDFLETTLNRKASDEDINKAIIDTNEKNSMMRKIFTYAKRKPSVITWSEVYDLTFLAMVATGKDMKPVLEEVLQKLEQRVKDGAYSDRSVAPRVLVTGSPLGGDATKVFKIIEEAGGAVVAIDSCTGMKPYVTDTEENAADPLMALSKKYLSLPCSCMTPNNRRLDELSRMINEFSIDVVIDVVLHACHSYNVESYKVGTHVREKHNLPFLKIETDYSGSDVGQIKNRVEALFETIAKN